MPMRLLSQNVSYSYCEFLKYLYQFPFFTYCKCACFDPQFETMIRCVQTRGAGARMYLFGCFTKADQGWPGVEQVIGCYIKKIMHGVAADSSAGGGSTRSTPSHRLPITHTHLIPMINIHWSEESLESNRKLVDRYSHHTTQAARWLLRKFSLGFHCSVNQREWFERFCQHHHFHFYQ